MSFPIDKLIDLEVGRYVIARASMLLADHLAEIDEFRRKGDRLAIISLSKVLNEEIKFSGPIIDDEEF